MRNRFVALRVPPSIESKAAVVHEPVESDDFSESRPASVETIGVANPTGEEELIEIGAGSLCHTDIAIALGNLDEPSPMAMGHEGAGIVREVGEEVDSVTSGDHVVLGRIACGQCHYCRMGRSNLCEVRTRSRQNGTRRTGDIRFSQDGLPLYYCHGVTSVPEYTIVTEEVAIPITHEVPLEQATLLDCGGFTGLGAVTNTAAVEPGPPVRCVAEHDRVGLLQPGYIMSSVIPPGGRLVRTARRLTVRQGQPARSDASSH